MYELKFVTDLLEEQLIKGRLKWLANFNEIRRDYPVEDMTFPIYASGGLREKGFFLSRVYSAMVVPKYGVHLLLYTSPEITPNLLRKILIGLKNKFGSEDWIFIVLVQGQPIAKSIKDTIEQIGDKNLGVCAYSVGANETITSLNVLGKGLSKQLKLGETKYENFDLPNYLKSFTATLALCIGLLAFVALSGLREAISFPTVSVAFILSMVVGYVIYKSRFHMSVSINSKGFKLQEGSKTKEKKWSSYSGVSIFISPNLETFLRLKSKDETFDLPLSRPGLPRRETYRMVKQIIKAA